MAEADSQPQPVGRGEAQRIMQEGLAGSHGLTTAKISSYGDPRLFALTFPHPASWHTRLRPLVPERLFTTAAQTPEWRWSQRTGNSGKCC